MINPVNELFFINFSNPIYITKYSHKNLFVKTQTIKIVELREGSELILNKKGLFPVAGSYQANPRDEQTDSLIK